MDVAADGFEAIKLILSRELLEKKKTTDFEKHLTFFVI